MNTTMPKPNCDILRPEGAASIDPALTVNEIMECYPPSIAALNSLGIDTCCGGTDSLRAAAEHAGVPLTAVLAAIEHAVNGGSGA